MGGISSFDFVPSDYTIKYTDSMNPNNISSAHGKEESTKGKTFKVLFSKDCTQTFTCSENDLTVGWLLSEVTRKYDELKDEGVLTGPRRHIVALKTSDNTLALDYYLTQLENSLSPIRETTLLSVYYAEVQSKQYEEIKSNVVTKSDFQFLKVIGCGGYSYVVLARKKDSGRLYAIKVIKKDATYMETNKSVYLSEASIMKKLTGSPLIVNLHYTFQTENELFFVMDPCIGGTLFHFFTHCARGDVGINVVKFYLAEVIVALEQIHDRNVMYRDLKPENILIDVDGHIKISDFGLSKNLQNREERSWTFCGSPQYLPPEMLLGIEHSRAVDFYTLGCLMYEMMVGFPPYHAVDKKNLYKRIVKGVLRFPNAIDKSAKDLIIWLLSTNPDERPNDFNDIKQHDFFQGVHWDRVTNKEAIPPWIPDLYVSHVPKKFTSIPLKRVFNENTIYKQANRSSQNAKGKISNSIYVYDQSSNREATKKLNLDEALEDILYLEGFDQTIESKEEECVRVQLESYASKTSQLKGKKELTLENAKTKCTERVDMSGTGEEECDVGDEFDNEICEGRINTIKVMDYSIDQIRKSKSAVPKIKCSKQDSGRKDLHLRFYKKAFKEAQPFLSAQKKRSKTERVKKNTPNKATAYNML